LTKQRGSGNRPNDGPITLHGLKPAQTRLALTQFRSFVKLTLMDALCAITQCHHPDGAAIRASQSCSAMGERSRIVGQAGCRAGDAKALFPEGRARVPQSGGEIPRSYARARRVDGEGGGVDGVGRFNQPTPVRSRARQENGLF
jgi:hypothetical protein